MTPAGLARTALRDLRRHLRHFAAASAGIVLGVAALVFFLGLGIQVRGVFLAQAFPGDHLEVAPRRVDIDLFALRLDLGGDTLDEADLEKLRAIPGVDVVYPKMRLVVPALASGGGSIFGEGMQTEIVADGVDPALVRKDVSDAFHEVDWAPNSPPVPCARDRDCGQESYCAHGAMECRPYIPALVSPYVVELYNGAFSRAYGLPKINPDALRGLSFEMTIGASSLRPSSGRVIRERMRLAGVSDQAIPLGVTLPLGHVRALNETLAGPKAGRRYHSAVLVVEDKERLGEIVQAIEELGLEIRDGGARKAALLTTAAMGALGLVGVALIVLAAAHIMHVFFLVVMVRRRELGLLRAVGARRADIRALLLAEAAAVGLVSGIIGSLAALAAAAVANAMGARYLPDFPFKPESFFSFPPWLVGAVVALAVAAAVLGALPSALKAAGGDPADALAGR
jgi:hypothetical protein